MARAECHTAAISRTGAALEAGIVASAIGAIPVADCPSALLVAGRMQWWPVDAVALLHEVDALWKVVSCHSETLMDLLSGCLAAVGCDVDGLSASLAIDATTATNRAGAALYIATDTRLLDTDVAAAAVETERLVHLVDDLKTRVASAASAVAVGDGLLYRDDTAALASSIPARELQPHIATAFAAVDAAVHSLEINMRLQTELLMVIQNNLHTLPPAQPAFVYENLDDLIAPLMAVSDTVVTRASSASVTSRASASQGDYTPLTF
ncbi:MAG: hypothetical protein EOO65_00530 [Methanosarcinales archaeon]|nr:MAG: hypothetical protein EOO65_00530 [Methanosarcinales archaeon]